MLYIYCRRVSEGARALGDVLNDMGVPTRFSQGGLIRERFREGRDRLLCWGDHFDGKEGINNVPRLTKLEEALRLSAANVPTIEVSRMRPSAPVRRAFLELNIDRIARESVPDLMTQLQAFLDEPVPPAAIWLPRRNNHQGGSDLRVPPTNPDFWSKKEDIREEYRVHLFNGKSIRAGHKIPREAAPDGTPTHEWIRSFDSGWIISYEGFKSSKAMRELAAQAVTALGLTFGAVDMGLKADGSLMVLEVNRAPGIEGGSVERYAEAIKTYLEGAS